MLHTKASVLFGGLVGGMLLVSVGNDLWLPRKSDLRVFDPNEVARMEVTMWRAYYNGQWLSLFEDMARLMRTQYHVPWLRSHLAAYYASRAAFLFKDGHGRAEYERALPSLLAFYGVVRKVSNVPFDSQEAARLELEWWIVHRDRHQFAPEALWQALANLQACIHMLPPERFIEHARARADAMLLRDHEAENGGVSGEKWSQIQTLLEFSWTSLWKEIR